MRGLAVLVGTVGCKWAFGLEAAVLEPPIDADRADADPRADLDRDGIKDIGDPCIAPEVDGLLDTDQDGVANATDACPFDKPTSDADQDGIADVCDPFPSAGDRQRCMMVFSDPDLNVTLWRGRDVTTLWTLHEPRVLWATRGSIVADWPIEGTAATTTFHIYGRFFLGSVTHTFDVLPRAAPTPQPTDAGCRLTTGTSWTFGTMPPSVTATVPRPTVGGYYHLSVTVQPAITGTNMRCVLRTASGISSFSTHTTWPVGNLGFAVDLFHSMAIDGIAVYERDDEPPL